MFIRTFVSAVAVIVIPIAVVGAEEPTKSQNQPEKKICSVTGTLGTRLGNVRRCRTQAEINEAKQESRRVVDRIQANKPTMCPPNC